MLPRPRAPVEWRADLQARAPHVTPVRCAGAFTQPLLGSGRTELVRALFGLERPASGTIERAGRVTSASGASTRQRVREGFGYVSEDRKGEGLALPLPITDNLCATRPALAVPAFGVLDLATQAAHACRWISELHIRARHPSLQVRALSGGNQQKVAIGRLLNQDAAILLLDEPTRGIDIGSKSEIYEIIARRAAAGCAVLVVSSYLPELFGICDRLAVMCRGTLSQARPIADWTPETVLAAAIEEH